MHSFVSISLASSSDSKWWELVPAALGAILGAAAGAIPAFWLASRSSADVRRRDQEQRTHDARMAATTAMVRLQRITNSLFTLHHQIEEMITQAHERGFQGPIWQVVLPMGGISPEAIRFDTRELALLFEAKRSDLANNMMLLSERHFTAETIVVEYGNRRNALGDLMDPEMDGNVGSVPRNPENERRFGPRVAALEQMAEQMRRTLKADMEDAMATMRAFSAAMQKHFDDPGIVRIAFGGDAQDELDALAAESGGPQRNIR